MAKINNLEGLSIDEINDELSKGAKFVVFQYCISAVVMSFRQPSEIFFIRAGESTFKHSFTYSLLTLGLGWWGIPWGIIYSIGSLYTNFSGGKDVTKEVLDAFNNKE